MVETKNEFVKQFIYKKNIDYVVFIKETTICYECYIQDESCGIIMLAIGIAKKDISLEDFIEIIQNNIDDYVEIYQNNYNF
jgi:hypothetical protein